jgi:hypothetical protein
LDGIFLGEIEVRFSSAHRRALARACCLSLDDIFPFFLATGESDGEDEISTGSSIGVVGSGRV